MRWHPLVRSRLVWLGFPIAALSAIAVAFQGSLQAQRSSLPDPMVSVAAPTAAGQETAIFAGGCFWGLEAVFEHLEGVSDAVSGYAGGSAATAQYERVGTGTTGHAEGVKVTYDPAKISYEQLLKVFFAVAHDPTQLNRQGPDVGSQYRSAIFVANPEQRAVAQAYIEQLNSAKVFPSAIVTQVSPLAAFYAAEDYHQNFIQRNPLNPYVVIHDLPKLDRLRKAFPDLYRTPVQKS